MTSEELNKKIEEICNDTTYYQIFGGKCLPYIGWYWREVDFDQETYTFGVLPGKKPRLAFMENNKWGYDSVHCPSQDWQEIKKLLEDVVQNFCKETLERVNEKIQSLLN